MTALGYEAVWVSKGLHGAPGYWAGNVTHFLPTRGFSSLTPPPNDSY